MVGLWPPETAGGGCGHGRERLGPFSLDNVTAHLEQERPWPPRRTPPRGAERPSLGTPAARRRNDRIHRNFADPDLEHWAAAYYGPNYSRLVRVKATYDASDLFRFQQSLPPPA